MQVTHLSAPRVLVFLVTLAEFIAHRHLNVQQSPAFMERNSLNIVNPFFFFKWTLVESSSLNLLNRKHELLNLLILQSPFGNQSHGCRLTVLFPVCILMPILYLSAHGRKNTQQPY